MLGVGWEQKAPKPAQLLRAAEGSKATERLTCLNSQMLEGGMARNIGARQHGSEPSLWRSVRIIAVFCAEPWFLMGQKHQLIFKGAVLGFGTDGFEALHPPSHEVWENKVMRLALVMGKRRHGESSNPWCLQQSQEANSGPSQGIF